MPADVASYLLAFLSPSSWDRPIGPLGRPGWKKPIDAAGWTTLPSFSSSSSSSSSSSFYCTISFVWMFSDWLFRLKSDWECYQGYSEMWMGLGAEHALPYVESRCLCPAGHHRFQRSPLHNRWSQAIDVKNHFEQTVRFHFEEYQGWLVEKEEASDNGDGAAAAPRVDKVFFFSLLIYY